MNGPANSLTICVTDAAVCIRVAGRANFSCSADFKQVIIGLIQQGRRRFVLDVSECLIMDSTFLGVLTGLVIKPPCGSDAAGELVIELCKPNPRVMDLLDTLGVAQLFRVTDQKALPDEPFTQAVPSTAAADKIALSRTSLEAHQALMEANPANIPKFKDVAAFLAEDLKKLEQGRVGE